MINIVENFGNDLGIKFNSLKTNYIVINTHTKKMNGVEIEEVKTIKYLGNYVTVNSINNDHLTNRIGMAISAMS